MAKYYTKNGIHIVEIPAEEFTIAMVDMDKRKCGESYTNAGYFGGWHNDEGEYFTLPVGHVVCDFEATSEACKFHARERGKFNGKKYTFDSSKFSYMNEFYKKAVSTLMVANGSAAIVDAVSLPDGLDYAVSGVPIMRNGEDVKFATYVKGQGWSGGSLSADLSTYAGIKQDGKTIYIMGLKTTTSNSILSAEAYRKFKALDMHNVIKLDGGGSTYMKIDGKVVFNKGGNRRINTIIRFKMETKKPTSGNPYKEPTTALKYGNANKEGNKWMQWELNRHGYKCEIDGSFGPDTKKKLEAFQDSRDLVPDASCGPLTKAELKK